MKKDVFVRRVRIEAPADEVFHWHARPGALERLNPPWAPVAIVVRSGSIRDGGRVVLRVPAGPFHCTLVAEHRDYQEGRQFRDVQVRGPFAAWDHLHRVEADGPGACFLEDRIEYALPLGSLGRWLGGSRVRGLLATLFAYRQYTTAQDVAAHLRARGNRAMNLLLSGASGLVGSALIPFLTTGGHRVVRLVRSPSGPTTEAIAWDPEQGRLDRAGLEGLDAVVHLAGESVATGRWNAAKKARIRDSRVKGTRLLSETLAGLDRPPQVLVCASATGYYGDRGAEVLTEDSPLGAGFLAEVCRDWEQATEPAVRKGIRVVNLRIGVILSPTGGALAKMLPPFRLGAGGRIGTGRQFMSWIALDDVVGAIHHALTTAALRGPVNTVSPQPVTNQEFTRALGRVLRRPTIFPLPAFAARLAFGEMADELLLSSARVEPTRLRATDYRFRYPDLEETLRVLLGKPAKEPGADSPFAKGG